jgi:hypothetical protein
MICVCACFLWLAGEHLDSILTHVRSQTLRDLIRPYRTVRLRFLADKLMIDEAAVQALLMRLILDEKVHGKIDQINGILDLSSAYDHSSLCYFFPLTLNILPSTSIACCF